MTIGNTTLASLLLEVVFFPTKILFQMEAALKSAGKQLDEYTDVHTCAYTHMHTHPDMDQERGGTSHAEHACILVSRQPF